MTYEEVKQLRVGDRVLVTIPHTAHGSKLFLGEFLSVDTLLVNVRIIWADHVKFPLQNVYSLDYSNVIEQVFPLASLTQNLLRAYQ